MQRTFVYNIFAAIIQQNLPLSLLFQYRVYSLALSHSVCLSVIPFSSFALPCIFALAMILMRLISLPHCRRNRPTMSTSVQHIFFDSQTNTLTSRQIAAVCIHSYFGFVAHTKHTHAPPTWLVYCFVSACLLIVVVCCVVLLLLHFAQELIKFRQLNMHSCRVQILW